MSSDVIIPAATTSAEPATTDTATDTTQKSAAIVQPSTAAQTSHTTSPLAETGTVVTVSDILLTGPHIDVDIQENVRLVSRLYTSHVIHFYYNIMYECVVLCMIVYVGQVDMYI